VTYLVTAKGGGSGNPVTFGIDASSTSSACTISDATVTFGQPGRCVIDANQAGNAQYQAAPQVQQVIVVRGIPQSIQFTAPAYGWVDGSATLSATGGGSDNPVEFSVDGTSDKGVCKVSGDHGTTVGYTASGRCVIDANQAGDARYQRAPQVQQTIDVTSRYTSGQQPVPHPAGLPGAAG
jgi:hypothetical protein